MPSSTNSSSLSAAIADRVASTPWKVWTPVDFVDLGSRDTVDKALQRLVRRGRIRRVDRGLYDAPRQNALTGRPSAPDYRAVLDAIARRDQIAMVLDGLTAANDLGLTTAVPARVEVLVTSRLRPIHLGNQVIRFRSATARRLYWADRPGMRVVQALHWLRDTWDDPKARHTATARLRKVLADPGHGAAIRADLREGLPRLPTWMQSAVRDLLQPSKANDTENAGRTKRTEGART